MHVHSGGVGERVEVSAGFQAMCHALWTRSNMAADVVSAGTVERVLSGSAEIFGTVDVGELVVVHMGALQDPLKQAGLSIAPLVGS